MGHSIHPSFMEKHEEMHRPILNSGPAIKSSDYLTFQDGAEALIDHSFTANAKQRYASTAQTTFALRRIGALASVPLQEYEVRNDMACGSTSESLQRLKGGKGALTFSLSQSALSSPRSVFARLTSAALSFPCTGRYSSLSPLLLWSPRPQTLISFSPLPSRFVPSSRPPPALHTTSIRETAGTKDMAYLQQLFITYFGRFGEVDDLNVD